MPSKLVIVLLTSTLLWGCRSEKSPSIETNKGVEEKTSEEASPEKPTPEKKSTKLRLDPNFKWDGKNDFDQTGFLSIKGVN